MKNAKKINFFEEEKKTKNNNFALFVSWQSSSMFKDNLIRKSSIRSI